MLCRVKTWCQINRKSIYHEGVGLANLQSVDSMGSVNGNNNNNFVIERRQDMEVHTASGRFVVEM